MPYSILVIDAGNSRYTESMKHDSMLRKKNITLNGKKADGAEKLNAGDEVKMFLGEKNKTAVLW